MGQRESELPHLPLVTYNRIFGGSLGPTGLALFNEGCNSGSMVPIVIGAPAGRYRLAVGMGESSAQGRRLPIVPKRGSPPPDDRLFLDTEIVVP